MVKQTEKTPTKSDWNKAEQRAKPRKRRCTYCGEPGHMAKTCPVYLKRSS